jgi:chromosomal replication initiation ATPase DnaA
MEHFYSEIVFYSKDISILMDVPFFNEITKNSKISQIIISSDYLPTMMKRAKPTLLLL